MNIFTSVYFFCHKDAYTDPAESLGDECLPNAINLLSMTSNPSSFFVPLSTGRLQGLAQVYLRGIRRPQYKNYQ